MSKIFYEKSYHGRTFWELPKVLYQDFTEGYRSRHLGKVVGEPTAGWIIFTSAVQLIDGSTLRLSYDRITATTAQ